MRRGPAHGPAHGRDEAGQVAGLEGLVFGVLVFVFGTLLVVNAWAVVDSASAASAAAREATRAFVEGEDADAAGMAAFAAHGRAAERASIRRVAGMYARCSRVVFEAAYRLPALTVPVLGGLGEGFRVSARHAEVVDPYRSGLPTHARDCASG